MPITRRRRANPPEPDNNNSNHAAEQAENTAENQPSSAPSFAETEDGYIHASSLEQATTPIEDIAGSAPTSNGNGGSREHGERQDYTPTIESGRRTSRGELFRRPPQAPSTQQAAPTPAATPLQPPSHEIKLPLEGNLLHLAYNPGYTASAQEREKLLTQLASETKAGGRARCWNCGSIAVAYDCWSTRSKSFGDVGVAFCEICGVWSVL